jgi:hypothetical protein
LLPILADDPAEGLASPNTLRKPTDGNSGFRFGPVGFGGLLIFGGVSELGRHCTCEAKALLT